jgi:hypothetical protein
MANVKISELTPVPTALSGSEVLPLVQSSATYKVTAQSIANLAKGTANYGVAQVINATGSPSSTYNLTDLFPTVTFTNKTISMNMQIVISGGNGSNNYASYFYNLVRNNASSPIWYYSSAYSSITQGSTNPSFIWGGTEASPTVQFYISGGQALSANFTIVTV